MPKHCAIWPTSKTCLPPIMTWVSESHTASPELFGWVAGAVGLAFDARAAGAGAGPAPRALGWGRAGTWAAALRPGKEEVPGRERARVAARSPGNAEGSAAMGRAASRWADRACSYALPECRK
eukprot:5058692-Pleurochrysis_carterae.AAC.1